MSAQAGYSSDDYEKAINESSYIDNYGGGKEKYHFQRWLIDDHQEILELQYALRGWVWDEEKGRYVYLKEIRMMTDVGARKLTDFFLRLISKGGKLTRYKPNHINEIMKETMEELLIHLHQGYGGYDMKYGDMGIVLNTFENILLSILLRGEGGMEQERLMTTGKFISEERGGYQQDVRPAAQGEEYYAPPKKKLGGLFG